ncbi:ATP-grasp domain-containing protein [Bacillus cereus group sp. MYBK108-2]|uniref:ATP-grasp domain-containing protein n=1 Tax=unclassified Bacillus cereus group TaxID=2750818 RepID=UPI0028915452|nr:ATP-grasp domain-containing protein [Bacillus cereus]MDA2307634.1 ATP-grasp domain-containing protein [Bacillus cereus]HDX9634233.1 ATP-grasp domain-containing protein [Bacillus cereus]HEF1897120.1 ATP-grasp domain-containing protein [Bacillus cereus]
MNRSVVIIESPDSTIESIESLANKYGDKLYIVSADKRHDYRSNVIKVDIRKEYDLAKQLIEERLGKPDAIFTTGESFMLHAANLEYDFGLLKNDILVVQKNRDKEKMKDTWLKKGISTPTGQFFRFSKDIMNAEKNFNYPVIVKPSHGYASCGVKKVYSTEELQAQINKIFLINSTVIAKENLQNVGCIVEECIDDEEYSVDTIWCDGKPICSGILSKGIAEGPYYPDRLYYTDPFMDDERKNKILDLSYKAVKATGLKHGPTHTEIRFKGSVPYVLETTSRPGAGGIFYEIFEKAYGVNFYEVFYQSLFNHNNDGIKQAAEQGSEQEVETYFYWYNFPINEQGTIKEITGIDEIESDSNILRCLPYQKAGSVLYKDDLNSDYFFAVVGKYKRRLNDLNIIQYTKKLDNKLKIEFL